jgi:hypothetical protein
MLYPTVKLGWNWSVAGAVQVHSRPYFSEEFRTQGYGLKADVLQAHLDYSRFWRNGSVVFRAGQLSSSFGSFLLRYDDADNPLIDMPMAYGYYYKNVTSYGLAGSQVDVSWGKFDARAQLASSSPTNRRGLFDHDQYRNWAGGVGYTIRQGLRAGASAYRGPYLHRQFAYFFPGEDKPSALPATGIGVDLEWGRGPWTTNAEWQRFTMPYHAIPGLTKTIGYAETRRVLSPRWYVAARVGYLQANRATQDKQAYEFAVGFRPMAHQLVKVGYAINKGPAIRGTLGNTLAIQFVTTLHPLSIARN